MKVHKYDATHDLDIADLVRGDDIGDDEVDNAKLGTDVKIGSLASLLTSVTSSVVEAINELLGDVDSVTSALADHADDVASTTALGHIKVDDTTIKLDGSDKAYTPAGASVQKVNIKNGATAVGSFTTIRAGTGQIALVFVPNALDGSAELSGSLTTPITVSASVAAAYLATLTNTAANGRGLSVSISASSGQSAFNVDAGGFLLADVKDASATLRNTVGVTNTATTSFFLSCCSNGTPAAGFATEASLQLESTTTNDVDAAAIRWGWVTATHASRAAYLELFVADSNSTRRSAFRAECDGTQIKTGVNGVAPVARAAAIAAVGAAPAAYNAAWGGQVVAAVNAALTAIKNFGVTN